MHYSFEKIVGGLILAFIAVAVIVTIDLGIKQNNTLANEGTTATVEVTDKDSRTRLAGKIVTTSYYLTVTLPNEKSVEINTSSRTYNSVTPGADTIQVCYAGTLAKTDFPNCAN